MLLLQLLLGLKGEIALADGVDPAQPEDWGMHVQFTNVSQMHRHFLLPIPGRTA